MIGAALNNIADKILALDEASLVSLWEKYKGRMERFDTSKDWEKAVIIFFIINAVRVKNKIFNEQIQNQQEQPKPPGQKPDLKRVK